MINFCLNVTCQNRGICRSLFLNYTCECLGDNYFGPHCEFTATKVFVRQIVSKSVAYIAILAMITTAMFIVIMDIVKYCFGIDLTEEERERMRQEKLENKLEKKRKPVVRHHRRSKMQMAV